MFHFTIFIVHLSSHVSTPLYTHFTCYFISISSFFWFHLIPFDYITDVLSLSHLYRTEQLAVQSISLYTEPPYEEISIDEFELYALDRLIHVSYYIYIIHSFIYYWWMNSLCIGQVTIVAKVGTIKTKRGKWKSI